MQIFAGCFVANYAAGMYSIIAPSFFQKKKCVLPGIGSLSLITHSAETDFQNTRIRSPWQEIVFAPLPDGTKIFNEFSAISEMMKKHLDSEGSVELSGIGTFTQDESGKVDFHAAEIDDHFKQPVTAVRVVRKDAAHTMLVGDKETTNVEMTEYFSEEEAAKKSWWWIWALVLGLAGLSIIAYYIYWHGFNCFANTQAL